MRLKLIIIIFMGIIGFASYMVISMAPYWYYHAVINDKTHSDYYHIKNFNPLFLTPSMDVKVPDYQEDYSDLWRNFHLGNVIIPLPTGHPFYLTVPLFHLASPEGNPNIGVAFKDPKGRDITQIYFLKDTVFSTQMGTQKLFTLPWPKKILKKVSSEQLWKDLFTKKIAGHDIPFEEMIYNLYLVQVRSQILPRGFLKYGLLPDQSKAFIEVESQNKDYTTEIILTHNSGFVYSYLLLSELNNPDSQSLRAKFLETIDFQPSDPALTPLIYREFKQLSFKRQTDQEGMLYLFSAWSHEMSHQDLVREMVYFLERGEKNRLQLKSLYRFAFDRFHKTFSTSSIDINEDDSDIKLQRLIEIEEFAREAELRKKSYVPIAPVQAPTPKEKMDLYLEQAKEKRLKNGEAPKNKLIIN